MANGHGGKREGSGRKAKADEEALIEKLTPLDELAFTKLEEGLNRGDYNFVKMFFEYRFGKAKEKMDVTSDGEAIGVVPSWFTNAG